MTDNIDIYKNFHQSIAKSLDLSERDVKYFRNCFFASGELKEQIAEKLQKRIPHLKLYKSHRFESYMRRLAFLARCSEEQWSYLTKLSGLEKKTETSDS